MLRETLKTFGAKEDILTYTNALGEVKNFPCWSRKDDDELEEAYEGAVEIEQGDKANLGAIGEADNSERETKETEEKLYSAEDLKEAEDIF